MSPGRSSPVGTSSRRANRLRGEADAAHQEMNQERWLLTYADMITLLLVLFIVLFALSKINQAKYRQFQRSVSQTKLVGDSMTQGSTSKPSHGAKPLSPNPDQLKKIEHALSVALDQRGLLQDVSLSINSTGLVEGLVADSTFFDTDSADLSVLGDQIVDTSGSVLRHYRNQIDVAGYTDDRPITGGPYMDNWTLSAARATTVVVRMTSVDGVDPTHVVAIGYGQYHPVVPNTSPAAEAQNRRVDILVTPRGTHAAVGS